jgi:hypothetical protein
LFDGARYLLTDENGTVDLRLGPSGETRVLWRRPDGATDPELMWLDAHFAGPHNARLEVGSYPDVTRYISANSDGPTMDVGGGGNGCNMLTGNFEVLDVAYASDGTLLRLALNLEQHCEGGIRADRVRIRINTTVPLHPPGVTANAGPDVRAAPDSTVSLDASASSSTEPGALSYSWSQLAGPQVVIQDATSAQPRIALPMPEAEYTFVKLALTVRDSQGNEDVDQVTVIVSDRAPRSQIWIAEPETGPHGKIDVVSDLDVSRLQLRRNFRNGLDLLYVGPVSGLGPEVRMTGNWGGPFLNELREGEYDLAYRYAFAPISKSGVEFVWNLGCNQLVGHFKVLEVAYDDLGHIERLAIDMQQFCLDLPGADQFAAVSIRYNSVVPLTSRVPHASAGQDLVHFSGDEVALFGSNSDAGATEIVEYRWRQLDGPPVALRGTESETATFTAPNVSQGGATLTFELSVRNADGFTDTDTVHVNVLGAQDPRSWVYVETFASEGCSFLLGTCSGGSETLTRNSGDLVLESHDNGDSREWLTVRYLDYDLITFTLISEPGLLLEPGRVYLDLHRGDLQSANFDVGYGGRGCNSPRSSMTIHELQRDANGKPVTLAADFVIACDGDAPVHGWLRVDTTVPKTASRPLASAGYDGEAVVGDIARLSSTNSFTGSGIVSYQWTQISGTPVTLTPAGADATFAVPATAGTLVFRLTVHGADGSVHSDDVVVTVLAAGTRRNRILMESAAPEAIGFGRRHEMEPNGLVRESNANSFWINASWGGFPATMWNLKVFAPFDLPLGPTNYPGVRDANLGSRQDHDIFNAPGMDFDWEAFHCLDVRGRYFVHEYVLDSNGEADRLAVDLVQSCGDAGPLTRAAVRINSAVPLRSAVPSVSAGPDQTVRGGRSVQLDGRYSFSWLDRDLAWSWTQVGGPAVQLSSSTAQRPVFIAPQATQDQSLRFELTVTDDHGEHATDAVNVLVLAPTTPSSDASLQVGNRQIEISGPPRRVRKPQQAAAAADTLELTANDSYVRVQNSAPDFYLSYLGDRTLHFHFDARAMAGRRLRPGSWTLDTGLDDTPMFDVGSDLLGSACLFTGRKTVHITEVAYDVNGNVTRLAFGYRYDCQDIGLTGVVRFNSADMTVTIPAHAVTPPPPPPPPPSGGGSGGSGSKGGGGGTDGVLALALAIVLCAARRRRGIEQLGR